MRPTCSNGNVYSIDKPAHLHAGGLIGLQCNSIQGVEFEGVAKPLDNLTAGVSYDYTDAKYRNYQSANASGPPTVYSGNRIPYVARDQWRVFANWERPLQSGRGVITLGATRNAG